MRDLVRLILFSVALGLSLNAWSQGLMVNEFSNGAAGNQEYTELVVVGSAASPTGPVDVTGWIIDDNYTPPLGSPIFPGTGVATGYIFITGNCFSSLLPGDMIVLSNANPADVNPSVPPSDPTDANADGVYIADSDDTSDGAAPIASNACYASCNSATVPCPLANITYGPANTSTIAMANAGDAMMTRSPGNVFFHGASYGTLGAGPTFNVSSLTGTGAAYYFTCGDYMTNDGNGAGVDPVYFRNLVGGSPGQTPGTSNTASNAAFLAMVTAGTYDYNNLGAYCNSTTPITLANFDARVEKDGQLVVRWRTATEVANLGFRIEGMRDGHWQALSDWIPSLAFDSITGHLYQWRATVTAPFDALSLVDVDSNGVQTRHGPFALGKTVGFDTPEMRPDWNAAKQNQSKSGSAKLRPQQGKSQSAQLMVKQDGIQRVSYEDLIAANVDLTGVPIVELALSDAGKSVPRFIGGESVFGPGSYIEFIGRKRDSLYGQGNAYSLRRNPAEVKAVHTIEHRADPAKAKVVLTRISHQPRQRYAFSAPVASPWYDDHVLALGAAASLTRDFHLPGRVQATAVAMTVKLWGRVQWDQPGNDHHVQIWCNGVMVGERWFDGVTAQELEIEMPSELLREYGNRLELRLPGDTGFDFDMVALVGFELNYQRWSSLASSGVTHFESPPGQFLLPAATQRYSPFTAALWQGDSARQALPTTGVRVASGEMAGTYWQSDVDGVFAPSIVGGIPEAMKQSHADYLVIAHPGFEEAVMTLMQRHRSSGLKVSVIDTASVFARYSDHEPDAAAIQKAIAAMRPRYVLLLGGDSFDPDNHLGFGSFGLVPTAYVRTDALIGFAPSDAALADWDGDGRMDSAIGRIPAKTVGEAHDAVRKILRYPTNHDQSKAVLVSGKSDLGDQFLQMHRSFGAALPLTWSLRELPFDLMGRELTRKGLLSALNAGTPLISYYGHSAPAMLDFNQLLTVNDIASLNNHQTPNVVTLFGCWNGYFVSPQTESIASRLMIQADAGAAAVLGAASLIKESSHASFGEMLFQEFNDAQAFGDIIKRAQNRLLDTSPQARDAALGYVLFGDPAMALTSNVH